MNLTPVLPPKEDETIIADLYHHLEKCWNERDFAGFSSLFGPQGSAIGFDGSQMNNPGEISDALENIFKSHTTAKYVSKIREVRFLSHDVAILQAVSGMFHEDQRDIDPSKNAIQTLTAYKHGSAWLIAQFQNTPAAFHGRPVLSMELTNELQQVLITSKDPLLV